MRHFLRAAFVVVGLLVAHPAQADPYYLLIETDTDAASGSELFLATYPTLGDFLAGNAASGSFAQAGLSPGFSINGFAFDGSQYHFLIETDTDAPSGTELFIASYNSLADFMAGNAASGSFAQAGLSAGFSAAGFTFDGSQYHLLIETDVDEPSGQELFVANYNSLADFMAGNAASGSFAQAGLSAGFSVGGFTFDQGVYRLLIETDADTPSGQELFVATYSSLADFMAGNAATGTFAQAGLSSGFSAAGFLAQPPPTGGGSTPVPEPSTLLMLIAGITATGLRRERTRG